jgi:hypothetical protein
VWEFDPMPCRSARRNLVSLAALAVLALAPVPALARDTADDDFASDLNDPRKQEAMGNAMAAMLGVMLNLKAEPLTQAMERMGEHKAARRIPRGATLGDLAGPQAKRLPGEVRRQVPAMMGAMGELAGMMQDLAPQLAAIGEDFDRQMDEAAKAD